MIKLKAIFPSLDAADVAAAEITGRYKESVSVEISAKRKEREHIDIVLPYQAYSGSVSTGGEMPMLPLPTVLNVDVPVSGDCSVFVECTMGKKRVITDVLRNCGAMSVEEYK